MRGFVTTPPAIVDYMADRLFRGRPPRATDNILDAGCGTGAFISGIHRWCKRALCELPRIVGVELDPIRASQTRARFGSPSVEIRQCDFLTATIEPFDFIIGNPPYVSILRLSESEKHDYRTAYEVAHGRFDLYLLFFERALKCLKPGGRMVFITPEKFLYVESAAPLRRLLARVQIEEIDFVDEQIFDGLVAYPTITILANRPAAEPTSIKLRDGTERKCSLAGGASWMPLVNGGLDSPKHLTLQEICARVSCGVATGADDVFVRDRRELDSRLAAFARPTIAGRDLNAPQELPRAKHVMLIPYTDDGCLLEERELGPLRSFLYRPSIRERLLKRTCVRRKPWYAFHETPPLLHILRPKILCKDITQKPFFWIDRSGALVPRHSVYYIVPRELSQLDRLCAYLNTKAAAAWLSEHCQHAASGFLRLQSSVLKSVPLPDEFLPAHRRKRTATRLDRYPQLPGLASSWTRDDHTVR